MVSYVYGALFRNKSNADSVKKMASGLKSILEAIRWDDISIFTLCPYISFTASQSGNISMISSLRSLKQRDNFAFLIKLHVYICIR
jgi:hypothetical protein